MTANWKTGTALLAAGTVAAGTAQAVGAQTTLDRVDPARIEATAPRDAPLPGAEAAAPAAIARAPAPIAASQPITVGAITLSGLQVMKVSDFADVIDLYVGRTLSPPALAGLTELIAQRMRDRGFVLATAGIPPQSLAAGILRVEVDEGSVDRVRLKGSANRALEAALAPLVGTGPVTLSALERRLLIAGDIDGLYVRRSRLVREGGSNILEVEVFADRYSATLGLDNSGSRPIGPLQADLSMSASQVFADDDLLSLTELITPTEPSELGYLRLRYGKRVATDGTEVAGSVSYARTRPGAYVLARDISGTSWTARLDLLHPLLRRRDASLWLTGSFGMRTVRQDRRDLLVRRDRLTTARIGLNGFTALAGGRLRAGALVSQGLDLFDATDPGDPFASRGDADGTFTTVSLTANWTTPIIRDVTGQIAVASQLAAEPLLVSEEIGLGGGDFLRGYDYGERSGDNGTMVSGELRWAPAPRIGPVRQPTLYSFVDGGRVTNLRGGFGTGTLFSAGGGVRVALVGMAADVGIAFPLSGPRYDSGNDHPVINFRLSRRF